MSSTPAEKFVYTSNRRRALERATHLGPICNETHYDEMVTFLNALIDEVMAVTSSIRSAGFCTSWAR
jgi:hypothetical protein